MHQAFLQQAELARVEAREAPHRGDALFEQVRGHGSPAPWPDR
jgi:hypothetical protein